MLSRVSSLLVLAQTTIAYYDSSSCSENKTFSSPFSVGNASLSSLPTIFAPAAHAQDNTILAQIRNTLALYPLCIDGKDFASLSLVFTKDAVANYSEPLNTLTSLSDIQTVLEASLAPVATQHQLGTQVVELFGYCAARSLTYFVANHFGKGVYEGQVAYAYGQYRDFWIGTEAGWRIKERTLAYMGPLIGNASIFAAQ
ncbi:hypothetical protein LTR10_005444 [Elasticomyces elasticus]|nr:hypothetical protein LTR10_005444 [Elasticomyces elasticus]KAK4976181.1 hypothetical protein LTR42_003808 [Elasticomyces elasticus]